MRGGRAMTTARLLTALCPTAARSVRASARRGGGCDSLIRSVPAAAASVVVVVPRATRVAVPPDKSDRISAVRIYPPGLVSSLRERLGHNEGSPHQLRRLPLPLIL